MKTITAYLFLVLSLVSRAADIDIWVPAVSFVPGTNSYGFSTWGYFTGSDTPDGSWFSQPGTNSPTTTIVIPTGQTVPPGNYAVSIRTVDYDNYWSTHIMAGGGVVTNYTSDRDSDVKWSKFAVFTATSSFTNVAITFSNTPAPARKTALIGMSLTSKTNSIMLFTGSYQEYVYPSTNDWDLSQPGTNYIQNGSFEAGVNGSIGLFSNARSMGVNESLDETVAFHGRNSLRIALTNNESLQDGVGKIIQIVTRPITLPANRQFVASFMARSTSTNNMTIRITNTFNVPTNAYLYGISNTSGASFTASVGTNWTYVSVTNRLLSYPVPDYNYMISVSASGESTNWFDCLSIKDSTETNYVAGSPIEIAIYDRGENVWHSDEDVVIPVRLHNSSLTQIDSQIKLVAWDYRNLVVLSSNISYSLLPSGTNTLGFRFPTNKIGHFRVYAFDPFISSEPDESSITIIRKPRSVPIDKKIVGLHPNDAQFIYRIMNKAGISHARRLSPGAYFRWSLTEPTQGNYIWWDRAVTNTLLSGIDQLANIKQDVPAYAARAFFRLGSLVGSFQEGETVRSAKATGVVSQVMYPTNFTGNALFISGTTGSWFHGSSVTGLTSGATATMTVVNATSTNSVSVLSFPDLRHWVTYCSNLVNHYKPWITRWEMANEPNQGSEYTAGDAGVYSEMLRHSVPMIKAVQTNSIITALGGALTTNWIGTVLSNMSSIGVISNFSDASVHIYPGNDATGPQINQIMTAYGLPWYNSESGNVDNGAFTGISSNQRREGTAVEFFNAIDRYYWGTGYRAASTIRNHVESWGDGATRVYTYDFRAYAPDHFDQEFTGLEHRDICKPVIAALASAAYFIDGKQTLGKSHASTNISAYCFDGGSNSVITIHSRNPTNIWTIGLPGGFPSYVRYDFYGNPVGTNEASFVAGRYENYLVTTNIASSTLSSFAASTVVSANDTTPPVPVISLWPSSPSAPYAQSIPLRWFAIDDRVKPETGNSYNYITYSTKLEPGDETFGPWTGLGKMDLAGRSPGRYTFTVLAKDASGNTNGTQETFWIGPIVPVPGNATVNSMRVMELIRR